MIVILKSARKKQRDYVTLPSSSIIVSDFSFLLPTSILQNRRLINNDNRKRVKMFT